MSKPDNFANTVLQANLADWWFYSKVSFQKKLKKKKINKNVKCSELPCFTVYQNNISSGWRLEKSNFVFKPSKTAYSYRWLSHNDLKQNKLNDAWAINN
jgi:hypothetical protein